MSQPTNDRAIVLSRLDYGEKDRIITLLCQEQGKIRALAKSVRSAKSKLAGGIELFSESQVGLVQGKSGLHILMSSRLQKHFSSLATDLDRTMLAYDLLKIIDKITEDGSGQDYYDILLSSLTALDDKGNSKELVQLWFDVQVLKHSGSLPNLRTDLSGKALAESDNYQFDYDSQCFMVKENGPFTTGHIKLLRLCETYPNPPNLKADDELIIQSARLAHASLISNVVNR